MFKKYSILLVLIMVLIIACESSKEQEKTIEYSGIRQVKTYSVEKQEISEYFEYSGNIESRNVAGISPSLPLKIKKLHVEEGDIVEKDQLLISMDNRNLQQAQAQFENLEKNYNRMIKLRESNAVDQQALDDTESAFKIARATFERVRDDTEIRTPLCGMVTFIALKEGDTYNNMFDPILIRIVNLDEVRMRVTVSDQNVNRIKPDDRALISLDDFITTTEGRVDFIANEAKIMSGKYSVLIDVSNRDGYFRHNQYARVRILTSTSSNTIAVPQEALIKADQLFVVSEGRAELRTVVIGIENEDMVEILKGVEENDLVIIGGNVGLSDDDTVDVIE